MLSESMRAEIKTWMALYPAGRQRSAVLPALYVIQREFGYCPVDAQRIPAERRCQLWHLRFRCVRDQATETTIQPLPIGEAEPGADALRAVRPTPRFLSSLYACEQVRHRAVHIRVERHADVRCRHFAVQAFVVLEARTPVDNAIDSREDRRTLELRRPGVGSAPIAVAVTTRDATRLDHQRVFFERRHESAWTFRGKAARRDFPAGFALTDDVRSHEVRGTQHEWMRPDAAER